MDSPPSLRIGYGTLKVPDYGFDFLMANQDLASIGKILAVGGFFSLMFGLFLFELANSGSFCSSLGPGCTTNYDSLVLPTVIGGALVVTGAWLFWVFKPQSRTPWGQSRGSE